MSSTITYKGNTLTTVNNQTKVLNTRGSWLEDDITITDVTSGGGGSAATLVSKTITVNGTYNPANDNADGYSSVTVNVQGSSGMTQHVILFEYTDETSTTEYAYYNDALIGSAITATIPTEHGGKEVQSASLDGVEWYAKSTYQFETVFDNNDVGYWPDDNSDYPYCWITALGEITIPEGSMWRVTFDGVEYILTGFEHESGKYGIIGNPKWGGQEDNGVDAPFYFYGPFYGAWSGGANVTGNTYHRVKIERAISV